MQNAEEVDLTIIGAGNYADIFDAIPITVTNASSVAGWYGLMVAKTYLEFHPFANIVVLDAADSVGGVWAQHRLYPGLKSNNMLGTYEYPDFPMDEKTFDVKPGQFIPGHVIHDYLTQFARKSGVYELIRFGTKVNTVVRLEKGGWLLRLTTRKGQGSCIAEKLVVATGVTSEPFMPVLEGSHSFDAPIFHVKDLSQYNETMKTANEVVVLGGTKSAWDAAYAFAEAGGSARVHMVIRETGHGMSRLQRSMYRFY